MKFTRIPFLTACVVSAAMVAPTSQEQECYEVGQIECVNTSAGWIATWPASQEFRDHMIATIDMLELSDELNWQEQEFCIPILATVKGEFRGQVLAGLGIYEFDMNHYHNGVQLQGRHAPFHGHPHYMFNRRRWGLMGTLMTHEVSASHGLQPQQIQRRRTMPRPVVYYQIRAESSRRKGEMIMRYALMTLTAVLVLATCTDQQSMMDAEFPQGDVEAAALDRASTAATIKDDARHPLAIAVLDKLIDEHPGAAGGRINLDGLFGNAYRGETITHAGVSLKRVSSDTQVEKATYTITFQDLKLTAENEAILAVGLIHAHEDGHVEDHVYDVQLARGSDGVWSADLTYKGHFDGEISR